MGIKCFLIKGLPALIDSTGGLWHMNSLVVSGLRWFDSEEYPLSDVSNRTPQIWGPAVETKMVGIPEDFLSHKSARLGDTSLKIDRHGLGGRFLPKLPFPSSSCLKSTFYAHCAFKKNKTWLFSACVSPDTLWRGPHPWRASSSVFSSEGSLRAHGNCLTCANRVFTWPTALLIPSRHKSFSWFSWVASLLAFTLWTAKILKASPPLRQVQCAKFVKESHQI